MCLADKMISTDSSGKQCGARKDRNSCRIQFWINGSIHVNDSSGFLWPAEYPGVSEQQDQRSQTSANAVFRHRYVSFAVRYKQKWMDYSNDDVRTLFGGPSQPEPTDERGGIRAAQMLAQQSDAAVNPNQYENDYVSHSQCSSRMQTNVC